MTLETCKVIAERINCAVNALGLPKTIFNLVKLFRNEEVSLKEVTAAFNKIRASTVIIANLPLTIQRLIFSVAELLGCVLPSQPQKIRRHLVRKPSLRTLVKITLKACGRVNKAKIDEYLKDATSGDYNNLLAVSMKHLDDAGVEYD